MQTLWTRLQQQPFEDPWFVKFLFGSPLMGFVWFFVRLYLGWQWLSHGWEKIYGDSSIGWVRDGMIGDRFVRAGDNILGFWQRAVAIPRQDVPPSPTIGIGTSSSS